MLKAIWVNRSKAFYPLLSDRAERGKTRSAAESDGAVVFYITSSKLRNG
ncbi:MAG: hypothetical protein ACXQTW_02810 [Candidatus Methanospirareceae archaeon]